ncbi:MAG: glycosyltransferase [Blastochloris sp.]|nr:glycosyltransferase [Blastochloris sp.]
MPKISLIVCLYKERDLLERLLQHAEGCYDDLVVVHDGSESDTNPPTPLAKIHIPSHRHPELAVDFSIPEQAAQASTWWKHLEGSPSPGSIHELVTKHGGPCFEGISIFRGYPDAFTPSKEVYNSFPAIDQNSIHQKIKG